MDINYWDLKQHKRGEIVEVQISGNAPNVRLMDSSNFQAFKRGRNHRFVGGRAKRSPVRLQIPHSGHWYLVLDYGGLGGRGRASVQVLPGALPPLREVPTHPLASIRQNVESMHGDDDASATVPEWDVFVSHATEDKDEVVRPLVSELDARNVRVWYDEFELRIGDSLRRKIDAGLARSRFGVVVLSRSFFAKNWPQYELDGLVTREMTGEQIILPLWHDITKAELIKYSPSLADKVARSTTEWTLPEIAEEIASIIKDVGEEVQPRDG
jgi:hypothetical protein